MLILTLLVATLIVVICFICLLYFVANVLDEQYIITSFDNNNYQLAHINIVEYYDKKSDYIVDERKYLNINIISFTLFILYIFVQDANNSKNFFDKYFNKHYDIIVY